MTEKTPADSPPVTEVYKQWWTHDARWYQGVAQRYGHQVANEINAEALRYVSTRVGRQVARFNRARAPYESSELRDLYDMCANRMFPSELRDGRVEIAEDGLVEITMRRNFAVTMVRMAGSLEEYECPCTQVHAGWSEGLGVEVTENRMTSCLRFGDPQCRLTMKPTEESYADKSTVDDDV